MNIQSIHWKDALPIRHQVLWPNKPPSFCKIDGDEMANHYGAYINGELVCVASIYIQNRTARLRKFATLLSFQGKGIGSQVLLHIISKLHEIGIDYFWCDARKSALEFYRKFGLEKEGSSFVKSNIPYYKMAIALHVDKSKHKF
jgi:predicted GNAT family N-acyltransferase